MAKPNPSAFNGASKQITIPGGSTTSFEFDLGSGSSTDPDASGSLVFSTEQDATSLLNTTGIEARFTAANPTGLFAGQIVRITGAVVSGYNPFNGIFRVATVSADGREFTYVMEGTPTGANSGTAHFTVFHSVSSIARADEYGGTSGPLLYFKVTTADKHRLQTGDTVSVWGASVGGSLVNPYNGAFRVERVKAQNDGTTLDDYSFLCALDYDPGANPTGTISWASQNSTALRVEVDPNDGTVRSVFTSDVPAPLGETLFAVPALGRTLVTIFGAVFNGSFGTPFNGVVQVLTVDRRSFSFLFASGAPGGNACGGSGCALAVATPLTVEGATATFNTVLKHGLVPSEAVTIEDPNPKLPTPFKGFFTVAGVPTETSFTWQYLTCPVSHGPPGYQFGALWQTRQLLAENNIVELAETGTGDPWGIAPTGGDFRPEYLFRCVIVRENLVRLLTVNPTSQAPGIKAYSAENMLVQDNVVDLPGATPLQGTKNNSVSYFNNRRPAGALIQGIDYDGFHPELSFKYDEVATLIEDAILLSL